MFYILFAIFLWSFLGIVIRLSGIPVHILMFFSCVLSASLIGLMFFKKELRHEFPTGRKILPVLVLCFVSLANTFSFYYAYQNTSIANAVLTHYTAPVIVALSAPLFLNEKVTPKVIASVALASIGLCLMLDVSASQFFKLLLAGDKDTGGIIAGLFSGFFYAAVIIVIRLIAQNFNPLIVTFSQNVVFAVMLSPFVKMPENFGTSLWAVIVMGIVHSTIAPVLYFRGMRDVSANKAAILGYLEPVSAIILGAILLGELASYKTVIGGAMILFSGYLTIRQ